MREKSTAIILTTVAVLLFSGATAQAQTFTTLYSFTGSTDGGFPYAGIIMANSNFYGTASVGGTVGAGVVYEVSSSGTENTIYSFAGWPDGADPEAPLIRDSQGNLYGTTIFGGANKVYGTVFEIDNAGKETVLYSFAGGSKDGCSPSGVLVEYKAALYGTTSVCGAYNQGTVFKLTKTGKETVLHSFRGGASDGSNASLSGLVLDKKQGVFYGVTMAGGAAGNGVLYKMSPKGKVTVLHSFAGGSSDGCNPLGTPVLDYDGNLYGIANACGTDNYGIIWKATKQGKETILHNFAGGPNDGAYPYIGVSLDAKGNIYGTTTEGGTDKLHGVAYELSKGGTLTLLHSFTYSDGAYPYGPVLVDSNGDVYGTALGGGTGRHGIVWSITRK